MLAKGRAVGARGQIGEMMGKVNGHIAQLW